MGDTGRGFWGFSHLQRIHQVLHKEEAEQQPERVVDVGHGSSGVALKGLGGQGDIELQVGPGDTGAGGHGVSAIVTRAGGNPMGDSASPGAATSTVPWVTPSSEVPPQAQGATTIDPMADGNPMGDSKTPRGATSITPWVPPSPEVPPPLSHGCATIPRGATTTLRCHLHHPMGVTIPRSATNLHHPMGDTIPRGATTTPRAATSITPWVTPSLEVPPPLSHG